MSASDDLPPPGPRPPCTFSSFVPLPFNKAALDAALRWSLRTKDAGAPLLLVGPSGTGKTHLARAALSARCAVYDLRSTMMESAADIVNRFASAVRECQIWSFMAAMTDAQRCTVVEHLEDLARKTQTRKNLFEMLEPASQGAGLLLTLTTARSSRAPAAILSEVATTFPHAFIVRLRRPTRSERRRLSLELDASTAEISMQVRSYDADAGCTTQQRSLPLHPSWRDRSTVRRRL